MVEKSGTAKGGVANAAAVLKEALADAQSALCAGEAQEVERRAKAISALVKAVRDVAELEALARAQPPEKDEEALRAELLGRIRRLVEADRSGAPDDVLERIAAGGAAP